MSAAREDVLREAERWAAVLRRKGYPEATVAPEYCIGNQIGPDQFFTRTVCVYAGPRKPQPPTIWHKIRRALGRFV